MELAQGDSQPCRVRRLLTLKQVCELAGVAPSTIHAWIKVGLFPAGHRAGLRCARWREDDVEEWRANLPIASEENLR